MEILIRVLLLIVAALWLITTVGVYPLYWAYRKNFSSPQRTLFGLPYTLFAWPHMIYVIVTRGDNHA